jgi:hypothetical protein
MTGPTRDPSSTPVAVDGNGELHDTNDIELVPDSLVPPLRCADCGAALEAVRSYPRRDETRIIHVAAHYRLTPGAAHKVTCPWRPVEASRPPSYAGPPSPASPSVYSLVVPARGDDSINVWRHHRSHRPKRRPAINSATSVANLLRRYGEYAANIRLDYRGRSIHWHDFLFTGEDIPRLERLLQRDPPGHPIAVVGTIGGTTVARSGRSYRTEVAETHHPRQLLSDRSRIVVRSSNERLLTSFDRRHPIVALGWWRVRNFKQANAATEISLWISWRWQIDAYIR